MGLFFLLQLNNSPYLSPMKFCSNCGSKDLVELIPKGDNRPRIVCQNCGRIHYFNPKIVVGCLPIWEDKVLLCKRAIPPCKGKWNVPAGYLENGETAEEGTSSATCLSRSSVLEF